MADIPGAVAGLLHGPEQQVVNDVFLRRAIDLCNKLVVPPRGCLIFRQVQPECGGKCGKSRYLFTVRLLVDPVEQVLAAVVEKLGHSLIGSQH